MNNRSCQSGQLQTLLSPIAAEMERVRLRMQDVLTHSDAPVGGCLSRLDVGGGKMLRAAIVLLAGQCAGGVREVHIDLGAVVEMVHLASLLHDDVIDQSRQRRGRDSANILWGNTQAVLLGDFVLSKAFGLAAGLELKRAAEILCRTAESICCGEIQQNSRKGDWGMTEAEYLAIIERKTASLFAACGELGALAAGAEPPVCEGLRAYGEAVGIAFQITDDVLDIVGDAAAEGKTLGTDLREEKPTLPVIYWLEQGGDERRFGIHRLIKGDELLLSIANSGAVEYSLGYANRYILQAQSCLTAIPDTPAKAILNELASCIPGRI